MNRTNVFSQTFATSLFTQKIPSVLRIACEWHNTALQLGTELGDGASMEVVLCLPVSDAEHGARFSEEHSRLEKLSLRCTFALTTHRQSYPPSAPENDSVFSRLVLLAACPDDFPSFQRPPTCSFNKTKHMHTLAGKFAFPLVLFFKVSLSSKKSPRGISWRCALKF